MSRCNFSFALPRPLLALAVALALCLPGSAPASGHSVDPAVYLMFDTSASMLYNPQQTASCHGDGSEEHEHHGTCVSRMFTAKNALFTAISGYPEVRWGLARFRQQVSHQILCACETQTDVHPDEEPATCEPFEIRDENHDVPGVIDRVCINYMGGYPVYYSSGSFLDCQGGLDCCDLETGTVDLEGADILVSLANDNDSQILSWLDHSETDFRAGVDPVTGDHCYGSGGFGDCELRAVGFTPLAGSLRDIQEQLSLVDIGNDEGRACRQYAVILLTDGDESCANTGFPHFARDYTAAPNAATALRSTPDLQHPCTSSAQCPPGSPCTGGYCRYDVRTYVIAFALGSTSLTNANNIASAGGTGAAIPAINEDEITAAIAQIASESVIMELCNGIDDNCDGEIDEGFPVGQACNNGGFGVCFAEGVYVCDPGDPTRVICQYSTTPILPGTYEEICDGLDNDCDGEVDENDVCVCNGPELCNGADDYCDNWATLPEGAEDSRVGQPCGTDVGACTSGFTQCEAGGVISCSGQGPVPEICDADLPENDQNCNGINNDGIAPEYCENTNEYGTCEGLQICNADGTWTCWARVPAAEACNNVDDNCNGQIDENLSRACQVTNTHGTCHGVQTCTAGVWGGCSAKIPEPEVCNGLDDNCNGQIDENLSRPCEVTNVHGTCTGEEVCIGGTYQGCNAKTPQAEICNNLDDNCSGAIDDGLTKPCYTGPAGTAGVGICQAGTQTCTAGIWSGCVGEVLPQAEVCDGLDNDCDGQTDEGLGSTTCGLGHCQNTVQNCVNGVPQLCNPFQGAEPEVCDGIDNDCDGVIDGLMEACYPFGTGCMETSPGQWDCNGLCRTGLRSCPIGGGGWGECIGAAGPQQEVCDGQDNNCDGTVDKDEQGDPISVVCYSPGSGENRGCLFDSGTGVWTCKGECRTGLRVCVDGMLSSCQGEVVPSLEVCDGLDNDCDGRVDEPEDIPGYGLPCGTVLGRCTPGVLTCENGVLDCVGGEGPFPGLCNGEDDNCDGVIDDAAELAEDDRVGQPCGSDVGACEEGVTQCLSGMVMCVGSVDPSPEVCDGLDNDCNGEVDEQVDCPPVGDVDTHCVEGACRPECGTSEFPCPGSLQCREVEVDGQTVRVCMPPGDPCGGSCPEGWVCENEQCVNPCDPDPCQWWETCHQGACLDSTCSGPSGACPPGEFCLNHACEPDPCLAAGCEALGGFCLRDCTDSGCSVRCEPLCNCPPGELCLQHGGCAPEGCPEGCPAGERCDHATSTCEADPCYVVQCGSGEYCFEGECIDDPCALVYCPAFYLCEVTPVSDGMGGQVPAPICRATSRWWVEGTGVEEHTYTARGRGGCQTPGGATSDGVPLVLLLLGLWLSVRRRQGGVR